MHKASSNKAYTVFEEGTAISYTFAAIGDASTELGAVYEFTLPYVVENEQFVVKESIEWAEQEFLKLTNPEAYAAHWKEETADDGTVKKTWDPAIKVNGLGVIKFPVYKDCKYIVNANGSKITAAGFAFSTADDLTIMSEDVVIMGTGAPVEQKVYSVIGNFKGDSNWTIDYDMVKGADGLYTVTIDGLDAGDYEFKIRVNHDWAENYGSDFKQDGPNCKVNVPTNGGSVTVTFDPSKPEITWTVGGGQGGNDVIWEGDGSAGAVSWNGIYRFALEGHDGANECIAQIPQATWDKMMTTPFFLDLEGENPQIRITNGWWDVEWVGGDIMPGNELLTDNGGGSWTLKVDLTGQPNLVATLLEKHLLFTGDRYTPKKIYFGGSTGINAVKNVKVESNIIFNLAGQKVDANYKGMVIMNGKKFMQK
jgi:hypothetical protein